MNKKAYVSIGYWQTHVTGLERRVLFLIDQEQEDCETERNQRE
jgi:hypothetical protein